jgi:hypothetical protein
LEPTLAIDLRVLEFVMALFLNMPPNNTALTKTLETYLDSMGYKLVNRVRLLVFYFIFANKSHPGRAATTFRERA